MNFGDVHRSNKRTAAYFEAWGTSDRLYAGMDPSPDFHFAAIDSKTNTLIRSENQQKGRKSAMTTLRLRSSSNYIAFNRLVSFASRNAHLRIHGPAILCSNQRNLKHTNAQKKGLLDGIRIIDLTRVLAVCQYRSRLQNLELTSSRVHSVPKFSLITAPMC